MTNDFVVSEVHSIWYDLRTYVWGMQYRTRRAIARKFRTAEYRRQRNAERRRTTLVVPTR